MSYDIFIHNRRLIDNGRGHSMPLPNFNRLVRVCLVTTVILSVTSVHAQIEKFAPHQNADVEVWRVTDNPLKRDWANYQNTDAWSPDGRYICYESGQGTSEAEVILYDFFEDKAIKIDTGTQPRWANNNNWLFYLKRSPGNKDLALIFYDCDTGRKTHLCEGVTGIGETDSDDRWVFGKNRKGILRIPIRENSRPEDISAGGALGSFMLPNPRHPRVMFRGDSRGANGKDIPYAPTRVWSDLEGNNVVSASPMIQRCHQAWTGDGAYHMHGNTQLRGRRWGEPFPSNLHYLARIFVNDPCVCGRNGRWAIGSGNIDALPHVDMRSGDGRDFLMGLSWIHDSHDFSYSAGSGLHDNDAKGSPDGTKVVLSSTYDLREGPVTKTTENIPDRDAESIPVVSTEGFPEKGSLSIKNEVIGYERKTATSFDGLTRELYGTIPVTGSLLEDFRPWRRAIHIDRGDNNIQLDALRPASIMEHARNLHFIARDDVVTSFDARLIPESQRNRDTLPTRLKNADRKGNKADPSSPLTWQRQTDVYITVIRKPDRPFLVNYGEIIELIPGENHYETRGYHLFLNGEKITKKPLAPGSAFKLPGNGEYAAASVEWSGLESDRGAILQVNGNEELFVRYDKPGDFQWTEDKWSVNGVETSREKALRTEEAVKEIVHRYDGVIHREWYNWGVIVKRHDLNREGIPIRHIYYREGVISCREYRDREGNLVSHELFKPDGYISESVRYRTVDGSPQEISHWWFDKGLPVKLIGSEGHTLVSLPGIYTKEGDNWVWSPMDD